MIERATPAGKWYAASLLDSVDRERGRRAWEALVGDTSTFTYAGGGCTLAERSLDEYARGRLGLPEPGAAGDVERRGPGLLLVLLPALVFVAAVLWLLLR
jgi:hypothetical protein